METVREVGTFDGEDRAQHRAGGCRSLAMLAPRLFVGLAWGHAHLVGVVVNRETMVFVGQL